jgi:heme exporter protein C
MAWVWFHKFGSPPHFYRLAGRLVPWLAYGAAAFCAYGLYGALLSAPADYQQGEGFRILYVHVPAAVLSMVIYGLMATAAAVGLIWRMTVAFAIASSCALLGASFTVVCLATGSLWGKPMWGTWWVWDPRLTSELVLLFLYLGYMGLRNAIDDPSRADRTSAVLAIVGVVNLPVIRFSVDWWNSLHQGHTLLKLAAPSMPPSMYIPAFVLLIASLLFFGAVLLVRARGELLNRERTASWIVGAIGAQEP